MQAELITLYTEVLQFNEQHDSKHQGLAVESRCCHAAVTSLYSKISTVHLTGTNRGQFKRQLT